MKEQKIYFPNLNGLRFIAAFLVIIHHIEQFKSILKIDNYWGKVQFVGIIGKLGVVLFFVLSGFLITFLLLSEEERYKKINIKQFYMRRILRIWPLYFLIIIMAFLIFPNIDMFTLPSYGKEVVYSNLFWKLLLYALIFPNLVLTIYGMVPYASHTWSIGAEEQYYLLWPIILRYFKKNRIFLMIVIIANYVVIKLYLDSTFAGMLPNSVQIRSFWYSFPIDCMAIGAFYSILLFQESKWLKYFLQNWLFYFSILLVSIMMILGVHVPYIHYEFYSFFFGIIILNFAVNKNIKISLENKVLNYLGNISYGLYMFHPIAVVLSIYIGKSIGITTNWFLYPLSLMVTIILAGLSYRYYESYFLRFKSRFTKIKSGISAKENLKH